MTQSKPGLRISLREAFGFYADRAKQYGMSGIPDAERLTIILQRMAQDVAAKKIAYQQALAAVVAIQDPDDPSRGSLAHMRRKLEKYNAQGAAWGDEYKTSQDKNRQQELMHLMNLASPQITTLQKEISSQENLLHTTTQTLELRKQAYETALAQYNTLSQQGQALVAQTNALKQAQAERERAMHQTAGAATTDTGAIMEQLQQSLEKAQASDRAAQIIATKEHDEQSLDEIIAQQDQIAQQDALVSQWIK